MSKKETLRRLRRRAFTLVAKLDEFEDLANTIYYTSGIPRVRNWQQELMRFYSAGFDEKGG